MNTESAFQPASAAPMPAPEAHISLRNIRKLYGASVAVDDLNLDIEEGKFIAIMGPSGCGKSTLLRCPAGLEDVTSGDILRQGDAGMPIVYDVDCIRDGRSFTTRRVVAIQKGRAIFNMSASFQRAEDGFEHQSDMPEAVGPDGLTPQRDLIRQYADAIPPKMRRYVLAERPIEIRPVDPVDPLEPTARPPHRQMWYRAADRLPDDLSIHQYLLAYASDSHFLMTAMLPHAVTWLSPTLQVASLDHAMWFHRPFRFDEWLLYDIDSPSASGACGLVRGQFFTRDGTLVVSTAQEGLIRQWD